MPLPDFIRRKLYGRTLSEQKRNAENEAWAIPRGKGASAAKGKNGLERELYAAKCLQEMGFERVQIVGTRNGDARVNPLGRDEQYDRIAPGYKYDERRRSFLKRAVLIGGGAATILALANSGKIMDFFTRNARAAPGAAAGSGSVVLGPDVDAKRIGGVRFASEFDAAGTKGSPSSPFTQAGIIAAVADLTYGGGRVQLPFGLTKASASIAVGINNRGVVLDGYGFGDASFYGSRIIWIGASSGTLFDLRGSGFVTIRDSVLDATGVSGVTAFLMDGNPTYNPVSNNVFERLHVIAFGTGAQVGVTAHTQASEIMFHKVRFLNSTVHGLWVDSDNALNIHLYATEFQGGANGINVTGGSLDAFGIDFVGNTGADVALDTTNQQVVLKGIDSEQGVQFLTTTANSQAPLTVEGANISCTGGGAVANSIDLQSPSTLLGPMSFREIAIFNGKNLNANVATGQLIEIAGLAFSGGGSLLQPNGRLLMQLQGLYLSYEGSGNLRMANPNAGGITVFDSTGTGDIRFRPGGNEVARASPSIFYVIGGANFVPDASSKSGNSVRVKAGAPTDADFTTPIDGLVVVDTTNVKVWVRVGGLWKGVTVA